MIQRQVPLMNANEIAKELVLTIKEYGRVTGDGDTKKIIPFFEQGDDICLLVNNLGGTSNFEMSIFARAVVMELEQVHKVTVSRLLVGSYMTAFDTHGASISIFNLSGVSDEIKAYLDASTSAPAWLACDQISAQARASMEEVPEIVQAAEATLEKPPLAIEGFDDLAKSLLLKAVKTLGENEALLTKYDTIVGDGDCGITMKRGANEIEQRVGSGAIDTSHPVSLFDGIASAVSSSMGGSSGFLLELCFRKMSSYLSKCEKISVADMCKAFMAGVEAMSLYGGATVGSRTMMDALIPAAKSLVETKDVKVAAAKAKEGAESTAQMKMASAGRSNYLNEETLDGTPDPGAVAVSIVLGEISP